MTSLGKTTCLHEQKQWVGCCGEQEQWLGRQPTHTGCSSHPFQANGPHPALSLCPFADRHAFLGLNAGAFPFFYFTFLPITNDILYTSSDNRAPGLLCIPGPTPRHPSFSPSPSSTRLSHTALKPQADPFASNVTLPVEKGKSQSEGALCGGKCAGLWTSMEQHPCWPPMGMHTSISGPPCSEGEGGKRWGRCRRPPILNPPPPKHVGMRATVTLIDIGVISDQPLPFSFRLFFAHFVQST